MKKLVIATFAAAAMATSAMAAEPLTTAQLDQVTATGFQSNFNQTWQSATAVAVGGCNLAVCVSGKGGNGNAVAIAENKNRTRQSNR